MKSELGRELRAARERQGMSLRALSSAAGISPSLLSQVETGKIHPSVSTLYALVSQLGVSLDDILSRALPAPAGAVPQATRSRSVQRREDNPVIQMQNGVTWERLATGGMHAADPILVTYQPGGASSVDQKHMRHSGLEYAYLIEGELTLLLDFDRFTLRAGDSVCFESQRPHLYRNDSDAPAKGLWFVIGRVPEDRADSPLTDIDPRRVRSAVDVLEAMRTLPASSSPDELR